MNSTQARVLELLSEAGGPVSGEEMSRLLGISRAAVGKAAAGLRALGYEIESVPHVGHRLVARPDRLTPPEITAGLTTARLGRVVHAFEELPSTQDVARELASGGAPDGTLVVAERQSAGRGRIGRPLVCPDGGIWSTVVLRGPVPARTASLMSLAAGVAVARAVDAVAAVPATLKWPNDVLVDDRKVAGILTEALAEEQAVHYVLVGVGINANFPESHFPVELRRTATTLSSAAGRPIDRRALLQHYLLELETLWDALRAGHGEVITGAWREQRNVIGALVRVGLWNETVEGRAVALDDDGALVVERGDGSRTRVTAGDAQVLPEVIAAGARPGANTKTASTERRETNT